MDKLHNTKELQSNRDPEEALAEGLARILEETLNWGLVHCPEVFAGKEEKYRAVIAACAPKPVPLCDFVELDLSKLPIQ